MSEESLKNKAVKGVGWSALSSFLSFGISFVVGIILARLLSPDDYGVIGLTAIFTGISNSFINAGFGSALIRKKDATEADYNTVFVCNLSMSIFLYIVLFICAPFVAAYFEREELISLTRVSTLGMVIGALSLVQTTRLTKKLDFKTQTKITITVSIVQGIVGVSLAFSGFGVWALVYQELTSMTLRTILLYIHNRWVPRFAFSMSSFKELFGFSSKLLLTDIINTAWGQINTVVVAKCYSPALLGQMSRASSYSGLFTNNLTRVVQSVTYPVLSEIQDDLARLKDGYKRIIKTTMLPTFACTLMLAAVAKPLLMVLIGEKWLEAAYILQIICFGKMLYPLHAINLNMLQVQGHSDIFLKLEIIKKFISIGPILIGIFVDIYWMLVAGVFTGFIGYYLNAYPSGKFIGYNIKEQVKDITPSFLISITTALLAWIPSLLYDCFFSVHTFFGYVLVLSVQVVIGGLVFLLLCNRTQLSEYKELKSIILPKLAKLKIRNS